MRLTKHNGKKLAEEVKKMIDKLDKNELLEIGLLKMAIEPKEEWEARMDNFVNLINALGNRIYEEYEDKMDNPEDRQVLRVLAGGFSVWSNTLYALSRMEEEDE